MQARTYLPAYGRFAQVDPAYDQTKDDPESWNLYNYVTNNPVTHTDPDGRMTPAPNQQQVNYNRVNGFTSYSPSLQDEAKRAVVKPDTQKLQGAAAGSGSGTGGTSQEAIAPNSGAQTVVANATATGMTITSYSAGFDANGSFSIQASTTSIAANANGYVDLRDAAGIDGAQFTVKDGAHSFASPESAAGFFNAASQYSQNNPGSDKLVVTDAGNSGGTKFAPHKTHDSGGSIDVRYQDSKGRNLQGPGAAGNADVGRMRNLFGTASGFGFDQNYSGRPAAFGTLFAPGHDSHGHIGKSFSVRQDEAP